MAPTRHGARHQGYKDKNEIVPALRELTLILQGKTKKQIYVNIKQTQIKYKLIRGGTRSQGDQDKLHVGNTPGSDLRLERNQRF